MQFKEIQGLETTKKILTHISDRDTIPHALLFSGQQGGSQLSLAIAFASYIFCTDKKGGDSCGICSHCIKTKKLIYPDLNFVLPLTTSKKYPTAKDVKTSNYLTLWRSFLPQNPYPTLLDWADYFGSDKNKQCIISQNEHCYISDLVAIRPFYARYKCIIIWLPEKMHRNIANGILKLLEEPPASTIFLLVTANINDILPTIVSRTQKIRVSPSSQQDIVKKLMETRDIEEEKARNIAFLSIGNMNKALKLGEEYEEIDNFFKYFKEWMRKCYTKNFEALLKTATLFSEWSKEKQKEFCVFSIQIFRETLVEPTHNEEILFLHEKDKEFVKKFSKTMNLQSIEKGLELFSQAIHYIERNANTKILFMYLSMQFITNFNK